MRCVRSTLLLARSYSHVIWLFHLSALLSVLTVMVYLHNSTCGLESPDNWQDRGQPGGQAEVKAEHVRSKRSLTSVSISHDLATSNGTMPDISDLVTVTPELTEFMAKPVVNPQKEFDFLHNPLDTCRGRELQFVVVIPSGRYNFDQRRKVRLSTLKHFTREHERDGAVLFFMGVAPAELQGSPRTIKGQRYIDEESESHGDIVQQAYMDTHRTLTTKSLVMLRWVSRYCSNAKYVIKLDDDIRFDTSTFLQTVERATGGRERAILGQVISRPTKVVRDTRSRYFVSEREFAAAMFPPYVLGGLVAFPAATARLLYEASLRVKVIQLDEVYVTGLLAAAVNVSLVSDPEFTFQHHSCGAIRV